MPSQLEVKQKHLKSYHPLGTVCSKHTNTPLLVDANVSHSRSDVGDYATSLRVCNVLVRLCLSVYYLPGPEAWSVRVQLDRTLKELVAGGSVLEVRKAIFCFGGFVHRTCSRHAFTCCPCRLYFACPLRSNHLCEAPFSRILGNVVGEQGMMLPNSLTLVLSHSPARRC